VKRRALEAGLPVLQPEKLRQLDLVVELSALGADVFVVVAYGKILPKAILDLPARGCVNVHGSILPRHRGAAPIAHAILSGDDSTGVTLMKMDEGMDTGPILAVRRTPIGAQESAGELSERLSRLGAEILRDELPRAVRGEIEPTPQDDRLATRAPPLAKGDGAIDWSRSANDVHRLVRAMSPWPGAFTTLDGRLLKVHRAVVGLGSGPPGVVLAAGPEGIQVSTGAGTLLVTEAQLEGRKRLPAGDLARGLRIVAGAKLV